MKLKILLLFLVSTTVGLFAGNLDEDLKEVDSLVSEGKYLTAINRVNTLDTTYNDPKIIYYRVKVTLEGFASSLNHRMFGFKNLDPGENIYDIRKNGGDFTMPFGDLQEELNRSLDEFPDSPLVNEAAGDYYNDLLLRYGDQLEYSYEDLYTLVVTYYLKAYEGGNRSLKVISEIGENSLYLGNMEQGVEFYGQAVVLEPDNPTYQYNLGFALFRLGDNQNALEHLELASEYYVDPELKSDAYGIMGDIYQNLNNVSSAAQFYTQSIETYGQNYYSQSGLLALYLNTSNEAKADNLIQEYILTDIKSFDALYKIIQIYIDFQRVDILESKLLELINQTEGTIDEGTIRFYLAQVMTLNGKDSKDEFLKAKRIYSEYLPEDHGILSYIDRLIAEL